MRLSVVIPALNEAELIGRAISSAWQAGAAEVIVVDGGSTDGTFDCAASTRCKIIRSNPGRAHQQNAGAREATGDVLLFLHADNYLDSTDVASQIDAALSDPDRLHGALAQRIDAPGLGYRLLERGNAARVRWWGLPYGDQAIFVRRDKFWEQGGFPQQPLLEDLLLMRRMRRLAWPLLIDGPVVVSPRRWKRHGIVGQTLRNWSILAGFATGSSPQQLARQYRRHDEDEESRW